MIRQKYPTILNSKGQPITLSRMELAHVGWMQRQVNERFGNSLGYEIPITTLTTIMKKITEQKFYTAFPADFFPVVAGEGAWSAQLTTYRSFDLSDEFETGIVNTGAGNARQATADAGVDALNINVYNWTKTIGWSIFDLELAAKSGNWDIVTAKEEARKKNWDLGIQRVAFLGARGLNAASGTCLGLLNQPGVTVNTTVITKPIFSMTTAELKTFTATVIEAYRSNNNRTSMPSIFAIPESDYNGSAATVSPDFPIKSILELLLDMFRTITGKKDFKILSLAYADVAYHADVPSIAGKQVYTLLNYDPKSLNMNIPVVYTNTLANSLDNFNFQNAGYGQFTGVLVLRPLDIIYFQYTPS